MLCVWCLGPFFMMTQGGPVHGQPMDGCGTIKNSSGVLVGWKISM